MTTRVPPAPGRSRRHSARSIDAAQQMHAGGWSAYAIAKILARRGTPVDERTVAKWVDPDLAYRRRKAERDRARRRNAQKSAGRLGAGPPRSPDFRMVRMESLRDVGLSCNAIAKVMTFDFPGSPITESQVRYAFQTGQTPAFKEAA